MPPRLVTVAIVLFWLATLGWFFQHDLWPRLRPGDRPPYRLDLANEVTRTSQPRRWRVHHNGIHIGDARSYVDHNDEDDTYDLLTKFTFNEKFRVGPVRVQKMDSTYRVTRDGALRHVEGELELIVPLLGNGKVTVNVDGDVVDRVLTPHWRVKSPLGPQELKAQPVRVTDNHSVLSPMQPWNRLLNLQENKTWRIELFDPLRESLANLVPGMGADRGPEVLEAGVLQGTEMLNWESKDVACLVIEYRGEGITGRTYVRQADGLVLRQEANRGDDRLTLERDPR